MHGLAAICHEARKGGYAGSRWPNHYCAPSLLDTHADRNRVGAEHPPYMNGSM